MYKWVTFQHLAQWTGGTLSAKAPQTSVQSISSDTRTFKAGEVFIALKGENFDGHDFLQKAADTGASLLISEKKIETACPQLIVANTLQAYVAIGRGLLEKFTGPVAAVTGSAGKSSTRDMIAVLLGDHTLKAPASFNNLLGVSKTLCLLEEQHQKLVLEVGMNHLGEIKEICEKFCPTAGLITNVGDAHIGHLGSKENIFRAKKELFDFLGSSPKTLGVAVNVDDPFVLRAAQEAIPSSVKKVTYSSQKKEADVRILEKALDPNTCYLNLKIEIQKEVFSVACRLFGLHHAENAAAAVALAALLGVNTKDIGKRLEKLAPAPHRGEISQLKDQVTLIDESYNSNPSALKSSMHSLGQVNPKRRRLIVIGEMRELGDFSEKLHREAAHHLVQSCGSAPATLLTVGKNAAFIGEELKKMESALETAHVETHAQAVEAVKQKLKSGDVLFVKGSHGVRLDLLVDALLS